MKRKLCQAVQLALAVTAIYPNTSFAYDFLIGCHWPNNTINWWYNPAGQKFNTTEDAVAMINSAASAWTDVSGIRFNYQGTTSNSALDSSDGKFVIQWADSNTVRNDFGDGNIGAYVKGIGGCNEGRMVLNQLRWTGGSPGPIRSWKGLITHELGHVIGLAHSPVCASVMAGNGDYGCAYQSTSYQETLRSDDIAGVRALYPVISSPPTISNVTIDKTSINQGETLNLNWYSNNQYSYGFSLLRTDGSVVNTGNFLSQECQVVSGSGNSGCLGYKNPSTATSASWNIPSQVSPGDYEIKVAIWNSQGKSAGYVTQTFTVTSPANSTRGLDLTAYCQATNGMSSIADLTQNNALGWACITNGIASGMDLNTACKMQHGDAFGEAAYGDQNDPYSWYCKSSGTQVSSANFWTGNGSIINYHGMTAPANGSDPEYAYGIKEDTTVLHSRTDIPSATPVALFQWQANKGNCDKLEISSSASNQKADITIGGWSARDSDRTFENVNLPFVVGEGNTGFYFQNNSPSDWYVISVALKQPVTNKPRLNAKCTANNPTSSDYLVGKPVIFGNSWKWNGNGSIISRIFSNVPSNYNSGEWPYGVFKDVTYVRPSNEKPIVFFQWMSSNKCSQLVIDAPSLSSNEKSNVTIDSKAWSAVPSSTGGTNVNLPYTVQPSDTWTVIKVAFNNSVSKAAQVTATCPGY